MNENEVMDWVYKVTGRKMSMMSMMSNTRQSGKNSIGIFPGINFLKEDLTGHNLIIKDSATILIDGKCFPLLDENVDYYLTDDSILATIKGGYNRIYYAYILKLDDSQKFMDILNIQRNV